MAFILIVEDRNDVTPLEIALASLNHLRIRTVRNGRDALQVITANFADIAAIVTDLDLPFIDGFELITAVRSNPSDHKLPIIVISGHTDPAIRGRLRDLGVDAFFTKPYSPAAVCQTLEGLLYAI